MNLLHFLFGHNWIYSRTEIGNKIVYTKHCSCGEIKKVKAGEYYLNKNK